MQFSAKKFMSLVFAAGLASATSLSLHVVGNPFEGTDRCITFDSCSNGTIGLYIRANTPAPDEKWVVIVQPEYLLDTALDLSQDVAAKIIRRPEGIVPYMTQTRVRVDLPTHPRFEASTTSTSTPMHTARAYREDRGHAGLLLGLPGAEMSAMLRVDAQSGPMDTVAQCVVTVLKVNADCAEREGEWPVDTVLADDREDEPNYLVVVVQSFCTGKIKVVGDVSPEGLDPEQLRGMWRNELRICFRSLDKPDTVIETYNLTLEDGFDATALAARAEIGERPITNRPGHGG